MTRVFFFSKKGLEALRQKLLPLGLENSYSVQPRKCKESTCFQSSVPETFEFVLCGPKGNEFCTGSREPRVPRLGCCPEWDGRNLPSSWNISARFPHSGWLWAFQGPRPGCVETQSRGRSGRESWTWKFSPCVPAAELRLFPECVRFFTRPRTR